MQNVPQRLASVYGFSGQEGWLRPFAETFDEIITRVKCS